jgi:phospholipid/cholesterol/gamma-HCH transport system substrate-binding protein
VQGMSRKYVFLGVFVIITLGLLLWLAANVGALGQGAGARYTVRLGHAAGLVEDNAVKVAGVKVGVVERVGVDHDTAVLTLRIDKEVELHTDTLAIVRAKSLLGEKYLQLEPGSLDQPLLEDGATIENVHTTFEVDEVLNALQPLLGGESSIAKSIAPLAERIDGLIASAEGEDGQPPLADREELRKSIDDAGKSVQALRRMLEDNEQGVKELIDNSNRVLGDPRIPRIIANLDRVSAVAARDLPELIEKTDRAVTNLERATAELTPERSAAIGKSIDDLSVAAANLRKISDELDGIGSDVGPLISNLAKVAERAASIDEKTIRKFMQGEGIRVNLGTPRKVKKKLREQGIDD